jgi:hypothetical protein
VNLDEVIRLFVAYAILKKTVLCRHIRSTLGPVRASTRPTDSLQKKLSFFIADLIGPEAIIVLVPHIDGSTRDSAGDELSSKLAPRDQRRTRKKIFECVLAVSPGFPPAGFRHVVAPERRELQVPFYPNWLKSFLRMKEKYWRIDIR